MRKRGDGDQIGKRRCPPKRISPYCQLGGISASSFDNAHPRPSQAWCQDSLRSFTEMSNSWKLPPILVPADDRNAFNKSLLACFILKRFSAGTD